MEVYRLSPKNPDHGSWERSVVRNQYVKVHAYNCTEARTKAAKATFQNGIEYTSQQRYGPIVPPTSPWELSDVTSCEMDGTGDLMPANHIVTEDGECLPIIPLTGASDLLRSQRGAERVST